MAHEFLKHAPVKGLLFFSAVVELVVVPIKTLPMPGVLILAVAPDLHQTKGGKRRRI